MVAEKCLTKVHEVLYWAFPRAGIGRSFYIGRAMHVHCSARHLPVSLRTQISDGEGAIENPAWSNVPIGVG